MDMNHFFSHLAEAVTLTIIIVIIPAVFTVMIIKVQQKEG